MSTFDFSPYFDRSIFTVAIICALFEESTAVEAILDQIYNADLFGKAPGDSNIYTLGRMGPHNVVLTYLPSMGKASAASAAVGLRISFNKVSLSLLVGICGAVPSREDKGSQVEILLGDLVISTGIVQYDFGRQFENDRPVRKKSMLNNMGRPPPEIRSLLHKSQAGNGRRDMQKRTLDYIEQICSKEDFFGWRRPNSGQDVPFAPDYIHKHHWSGACTFCHIPEGRTCQKARESSCQELGCDLNIGCDTDRKVARRRHAEHLHRGSTTHDIQIHWGLVASGDSVIKSGRMRDSIAMEENVIAFEMEGAGLWDVFPTIIIKGVCDYADSHKHKGWQRFAAVVAASGAKALLSLQTDLSQSRTQDTSPESSLMITRSSTMSPQLSTVLQDSATGAGLPVWSVPFDQPDELFGRSSELERLEKSLFSSALCPKVAIEGLGGVGKTRLALEIACSIKKNHPEYSVFWAQCSDVASFERDCRRIAQDLDLPSADDLSHDAKVLVKQYLDRGGCRNWLLILDNADDETLWSRTTTDQTRSLIGYIPKERTGAVLVTTRNHRVAVDIARKEIIKLTQLQSSESRHMFENLVERSEILADEETTSQLLEYLTHLPLAIVQAAAFINYNNLSDIQSYLEIWNKDVEDQIIEILSEDFSDDIRYQDSQNAVAKTWLISFKHISVQNPLAAQVMFHMACLDPKDIRKSTLPPMTASTLQQDKAFGTLKNYAFIQSHQRESSDLIFDMHPLVHLATRNYLRQLRSFSEQLQIAAQHLLGLIPKDRFNTATYWHCYLPHAEKLVSTHGSLDSSVRSDLQELLGTVYFYSGSYDKSLPHRHDLVNELEQRASQASSKLILNQSALSETLRLLGKWQESLIVSQKAYESAKCFLDLKDPVRLRAMQALAHAYRAEGDSLEALQISHELVTSLEQCKFETREAQQIATMDALHTHAAVNHCAEYWQESKIALLAALESANHLSGHAQIISKAELELDLAWTYCRSGEPDYAERLVAQTRRSLRAQLGRLHRLNLQSILVLADIYSFQERYAEAEPLYRQLLANFAEVGRLHDGAVLRCRHHLATAIQQQGRHEEARELHLKNIGIAAQISGSNSSLTLHSLEVLSWFYWRWGKRSLALKMLRSCEKRSRGIMGETNKRRLQRLEHIQSWKKAIRRQSSMTHPS